MIQPSEWKWFGNAGHLCIGHLCRFHLCTQVGKYIISTVGEYFPDAHVREIFAQTRDVKLEGKGDAREADYMQKIGFEDLGFNRKYETMVFQAGPDPCPCGCGLPRPSNWSDLDMAGYNTAQDATEGHMRLCDEYANNEQ